MITTEWLYPSHPLWDDLCRVRETALAELSLTAEFLCAADEESAHLLVLDGKTPVACGKISFGGELVYVAVLAEHRGKGFGDFAARLLLRRAFDSGNSWQYAYVPMSVQNFYERLGFALHADGEEGYVLLTREGDISSGCRI